MRLTDRGGSARPRRFAALGVTLLTVVAAGVLTGRSPVDAQAGTDTPAGSHADHGHLLSPEQEAAALALQSALRGTGAQAAPDGTGVQAAADGTGVQAAADGAGGQAGPVGGPAAQAAPVRGSEFRADCASKGRGPDDPIVRPGQPGASHVHEFFGNTTTNAYTNLASLINGGTNCNPQADRSAYWVPTLYQYGVPVAPEHVTVYYQGITDRLNVKPYPQGLKMLVGNPLATSPEANPAARWSCRGYPQSSRDFPTCPAGSRLETYLDFPTCWDGRNLDSADHRGHLAFGLGGIGGTCPTSHPTPLPRLELLITYPVHGGGLTLAGTRNGANVTDAPGHTFHGDFINAWDVEALRFRVQNCIVAGYVCGNDGQWIQQ
ncbi:MULTISPECIES: DUF1996 domain-containing protein [Micromonospora]|uniref:DUF1996 domain-containing protein n=1 Tax=Micromonospora yangpuensis TaxID=683228 RepID=A0A1C6U4G7_9ACTN|nr:DUF1996 domain-containing protein [Micromonospora yangpuensis]GGL92561.1 hypothetical protein GCM10012279_07770 [Micromonospora yangpuensis]SCL48960.1 protein of unknown function [Micromonospora yangpuensis]